MPRRLPRYDFSSPPVRRYDWERFTDGSIWRLREGEDIASITNFRTYLAKQARRRGLTYRATTPQPGVLVFQFFTEEEVA